MAVYTDSPGFAATFFPSEAAEGPLPRERIDRDSRSAVPGILGESAHVFSIPAETPAWPCILVTEHAEGSQYDRLVELVRDAAPLPRRVLCLAGSGSGFHGFKGRAWAALPGNLHLSVYLSPGRAVERFDVAFTVLAALSVSEALDQIAGLKTKTHIKWVNDILLGEAKVAGVLAYTQSQGNLVTAAVLGMGINVETTPGVSPTPFVPRATSVREALSPWRESVRASLFRSLLERLAQNYETLMDAGVDRLLEEYRRRSMVLGRYVTVCSEASNATPEVVAEGRVLRIGDNLELWLGGRPAPLTGGRLILGRPRP